MLEGETKAGLSYCSVVARRAHGPWCVVPRTAVASVYHNAGGDLVLAACADLQYRSSGVAWCRTGCTIQVLQHDDRVHTL